MICTNCGYPKEEHLATATDWGPCGNYREGKMTGHAQGFLDCMEYMPLTLKPLENPNHDPGEHWVLDAETAYVFKLGCERDRAERIVATLNAAHAVSADATNQQPVAWREEIMGPGKGWYYDEKSWGPNSQPLYAAPVASPAAPAADETADLTEGQKDTLARIASAKAAGIQLHQFWLDFEAALRQSPAAPAADVTQVQWNDADYARARDCMLEVLEGHGWCVRGRHGESRQFDDAFQHAVGILALNARGTSPAAMDEAHKTALALLEKQAKEIQDCRTINDALHDALNQAVSWIEECGSDYEGRQFVLTEARAALKGIKVVRSSPAATALPKSMWQSPKYDPEHSLVEAVREMAQSPAATTKIDAPDNLPEQLRHIGTWIDSGEMPSGLGGTLRMAADEITQLRSQVAGQPKWRPMGDVPKDGAPVDLWVRHCDPDCGERRFCDMVLVNGEKWRFSTGRVLLEALSPAYTPVAWRHVPAGPSPEVTSTDSPNKS